MSSQGLIPELQELTDALTEFKENLINPKEKSAVKKKSRK
jgi:hypothetical protein